MGVDDCIELCRNDQRGEYGHGVAAWLALRGEQLGPDAGDRYGRDPVWLG